MPVESALVDPDADDALTVVVPAWKHTYLREALASIAAQTDQRFVCHVFDDAGDPEIAAICAEHPTFRYLRFPSNLGGRSLVAHWNRCLAQIDTRWVWLFSDDDVMSMDCVRAFRATRVTHPECLVFQFHVDMVSQDLKQVLWTFRPSEWESAADFVSARFSQTRLSCLPDHIFDWAALRTMNGGIVDLPLAWNADDATWALLANRHGIGGIPDGKLSWRQSSENISNGTRERWRKLSADVDYLRWLDKQRLRPPAGLVIRWLASRVVNLYGFGVADLPRLRQALTHDRWSVWSRVIALMLRRSMVHVRDALRRGG